MERMGWSCVTRNVTFGLIVAIGITLTLPQLVLGAARSFGSPGRFKGSRIQRHLFFPRSFAPFGFVGVDGFDGDQVIIIQQFTSAPTPTTEASGPAENRIYVPPQWVDGGYGVQILRPGYWTEPTKAH
jgi:hypothetical protein